MPGTRDEISAPWYTVDGDTSTTLSIDFEEEPTLVQGQVSGAWIDFGITPPPSLTLFSPDSVAVLGLCRVDEDGFFSVPVFVPGPVKILVSQKDVEQWIGGPGFAEATVFDLQPGQAVSGIDLVQSGMRIDARGDKSIFWGPGIELYDPVDIT